MLQIERKRKRKRKRKKERDRDRGRDRETETETERKQHEWINGKWKKKKMKQKCMWPLTIFLTSFEKGKNSVFLFYNMLFQVCVRVVLREHFSSTYIVFSKLSIKMAVTPYKTVLLLHVWANADIFTRDWPAKDRLLTLEVLSPCLWPYDFWTQKQKVTRCIKNEVFH